MRVPLICLSLAFSASLSAQEPSSSPIGTSPAASEPGSTQPSSPSDRLSWSSSELGTIADELETLLTELDASLSVAGVSLSESERSLERSIRSATSSIDSLLETKAEAARLERRLKTELWIWRGVAVLGFAAGAAGLACAASR
jgi:hypothetical protein